MTTTTPTTRAAPPTHEQLYAALLTSLPACGPARLTRLLADATSPADAWDTVLAGRARTDAHGLSATWAAYARKANAIELAAQLDSLGVTVLIRGRPGYPPDLADDPDPPAVLFVTGTVHDALDTATPRVAIVGTRRCTGYGSDVARALGRDLAAAGVTVVSGLAAGIDGAAHEGVLAASAAPPVAVVGSGLDVVYPRRHRRLWRQVADTGVVIAEAPLGAAPEPWRFPLRNRIIAGLSSVVVVVESHAGGGSMHTVQAAVDRGVPVMAVPGSVRSPSSIGTNRLLVDGVPPVLDATDVLVALSIVAPPRQAEQEPTNLSEAEQRTRDAIDWSPTSTEDLLRRTGFDLGQVAAALTQLEIAGLARAAPGGCWERMR